MYSTKLPMYLAPRYKPTSSGHATMSNVDMKRRQQTMRNLQQWARKTRSMNDKNNSNYNDPAYPVNVASWNLRPGNTNVKSKATAARANYNIFNRSRHAALWKNEFAKANATTKTRKHRGGVDEKAATELFRELTSTSAFRFGTTEQRYDMLKNFLKAKKADLATIPEYGALLQLILMKYNISPNIKMKNLK
jgi:hypothetical protein